jgi:hypothetical protein
MRDLTTKLLPAFVLAVGCGGATEDPGASSVPADASAAGPSAESTARACELLTVADVEALFGAPARPAEELNREAQCGYWAPETGAAGVTLRLNAGSEFHSSWASDNLRQTSEVTDVDGLGEAAVWVADMNMLAVLAADRTHVLVGAGNLDVKRQLMERILARR